MMACFTSSRTAQVVLAIVPTLLATTVAQYPPPQSLVMFNEATMGLGGARHARRAHQRKAIATRAARESRTATRAASTAIGRGLAAVESTVGALIDGSWRIRAVLARNELVGPGPAGADVR